MMKNITSIIQKPVEQVSSSISVIRYKSLEELEMYQFLAYATGNDIFEEEGTEPELIIKEIFSSIKESFMESFGDGNLLELALFFLKQERNVLTGEFRKYLSDTIGSDFEELFNSQTIYSEDAFKARPKFVKILDKCIEVSFTEDRIGSAYNYCTVNVPVAYFFPCSFDNQGYKKQLVSETLLSNLVRALLDSNFVTKDQFNSIISAFADTCSLNFEDLNACIQIRLVKELLECYKSYTSWLSANWIILTKNLLTFMEEKSCI